MNASEAKEIILDKEKIYEANYVCLHCEANGYLEALEGEEVKALVEASEALYRTALNYRLKKEEKSRDWKEHLERFDINAEYFNAAMAKYREAVKK